MPSRGIALCINYITYIHSMAYSSWTERDFFPSQSGQSIPCAFQAVSKLTSHFFHWFKSKENTHPLSHNAHTLFVDRKWPVEKKILVRKRLVWAQVFIRYFNSDRIFSISVKIFLLFMFKARKWPCIEYNKKRRNKKKTHTLRFNKMIRWCMTKERIEIYYEIRLALTRAERGLWFTLSMRIYWFRLNLRYELHQRTHRFKIKIAA